MEPCLDPLVRILNLEPGNIIFFAGGGGKTGALQDLARVLNGRGHPVILTVTAQVLGEEFAGYPQVRMDREPDPESAVARALSRESRVFVAGGFREDKGKFTGISREDLLFLHRRFPQAYVLAEADGSRNLPCKVPKAHEPVIYPEADRVIWLLGAEAIGREADETVCYNSCALPDLLQGEGRIPEDPLVLTPAVLTTLILSSAGGKKLVPQTAEFLVLINKTDLPGAREPARALAGLLKRAGTKACLCSLRQGSLEEVEIR